MKSYNNVVELFVERNGIEQFVDENNVVWYNLDNIIEVIDTNMDWYKHLFTTNKDLTKTGVLIAKLSNKCYDKRKEK